MTAYCYARLPVAEGGLGLSCRMAEWWAKLYGELWGSWPGAIFLMGGTDRLDCHPAPIAHVATTAEVRA